MMDLPRRELCSATQHIEWIASRAVNTTALFIYDVALQAAFGHSAQHACKSDVAATSSFTVVQTRPGAGANLLANLAGPFRGPSTPLITALITTDGFAPMVPSLCHAPLPRPAAPRLRIHVASSSLTASPTRISASLAPISAALASLPDHFAVILSSTAQESVDLAAVSHQVTDKHTIHIFDHCHASRELRSDLIAPKNPQPLAQSNFASAVAASSYSYFDFFGPPDAQSVIVVLNGVLAASLKTVVAAIPGLALIVVRVLRPWDSGAFANALPHSVRTIHVFEEVASASSGGVLEMDVLISATEAGVAARVRPKRLTAEDAFSILSGPSVLYDLVSSISSGPSSHPVPKHSNPVVDTKRILFFSKPSSTLHRLPAIIAKSFSTDGICCKLLTDLDMVTRKDGVAATKMVLHSKSDPLANYPIHLLFPTASKDASGSIDFLVMLDDQLTKSHTHLEYLKPKSSVLFITFWSPEELVSQLPAPVRRLIKALDLRLFHTVLNQHPADVTPDQRLSTQLTAAYMVFVRLYLGSLATDEAVLRLTHMIFGSKASAGARLTEILSQAVGATTEIRQDNSILGDGGQIKGAQESFPLPFEANSLTLGDAATEVRSSDVALVGKWHDAAKHILFDAYLEHDAHSDGQQKLGLRPDVTDRTYLVTCTVNRRLTPLDYDRNVFHLEFDTSRTGLKYAIGEALGVHGWNDASDVLDFCHWYGVDADKLITIPAPTGDMHTRTIFQALQQQIDLFGRPGKSFYSALAEHAMDRADRLALQFIGSPEGSSTFKKLGEKDTVTFADALKRYSSARPGIETLCELVGDIKPRHYSIASSQAVVGDRVDLLVVTVEWSTPSGSPRYGQCTRYLAGLKVGQKVTVSVKPSVMKLPPNPMQPLILAGLGTGAAPFRAFLQHRAWLAQQGIASGPLYYYFGSRYRRQEYLYGEEIEAFILDGTIDRAGLAFSRDGKKKVYIQHLMKDDAQTLVEMIQRHKGVFYLCGPTWPVPDVFETLVAALVSHIGLSSSEAAQYLEDLKEEERYVLEVY